MNDQSLGQHYLEDALHTFRDYKKLAERAFAQTSDEDFFRTIDDESNSIAVIVKHMAGNMLSRWTDFLTTDGEKPDRNRDMEFVMLPEHDERRDARFLGEGLAMRLRGHRTSDARRSDEDGQDSRPGSHRRAGYQSSDLALRESRRSNHLSREAFQIERVADAERAEKQVGGYARLGVQSKY